MSELTASPSQRSLSRQHAKSRTRNTSDDSLKRELHISRSLLKLESDVRQISDERELAIHLCNASRSVLDFDQCFFLVARKGKVAFRLTACSGVECIDRNAPSTIGIEHRVTDWLQHTDPQSQRVFYLKSEDADNSVSHLIGPQTDALWTPQNKAGECVGGIITLRDQPWSVHEQKIAQRLADIYLHARAAIKGRKRVARQSSYLKPASIVLTLGLVGLAFLPVRISALAPVEVVAADPYIIAAPFDGVVQSIIPLQGQSMTPGDQAIQFDDVHYLNEKLLAEGRMAVSEARLKNTSQLAIADPRAKRDLEVLRTEYELAKTEYQYASSLFEKTKLSSPVDGVAIYTDKQDWEGRPVAAGEAIISIADPGNIELSIRLPVKESIVLEQGADIKVFLDSDPLTPLHATLKQSSFSASPDERGILSYHLTAHLTENEAPPPRIGIQGVAQVMGPDSTLGYSIFRRPYNALRQLTGW